MERIINFITNEYSMEKHYRNQIKAILNEMNQSEAIELIESIGKEYRRKNSVRINSIAHRKLIELDRPDLAILKSKK